MERGWWLRVEDLLCMQMCPGSVASISFVKFSTWDPGEPLLIRGSNRWTLGLAQYMDRMYMDRMSVYGPHVFTVS